MKYPEGESDTDYWYLFVDCKARNMLALLGTTKPRIDEAESKRILEPWLTSLNERTTTLTCPAAEAAVIMMMRTDEERTDRHRLLNSQHATDPTYKLKALANPSPVWLRAEARKGERTRKFHVWWVEPKQFLWSLQN